ncbi:YhgE/Pip family protein [Streptomyces sp. NPDC059985]|uniref:YhgE/Pip domain-containing protein n=1 Tax=Streptomyces sp. NPDC059985 TaxID=3347025 RepID=UPI003692207B
MELQRFRGRRLQWIPAILVLLPLISGALALASLWDPQARMSRVPAAIVNLDQPAQGPAEKNSTPLRIEAGKRLAEELKLSRGLTWRTLSNATAMSQLQQGKVYAVLVIPKDYSSAVAKSLAGDGAPQASLRLVLNDANGFLAGEAAKAYGQTIEDRATAIALSFLSQQSVDMWDAVRRNVDKALNSSATPQPGTNDPTVPQQTAAATLQQIAQQLTETTSTIGQINEAVQNANSGTAAMSAQINNATASAQVTQDSASTGNAALVQQSSSQATTSVRLAQSGVNGVSTQLQAAATTSKGLLEKVTALGSGAKSLASAMGELEKSLQTLAKSIPPAQTAPTAGTGRLPVTVVDSNLHPAGVLGRGLAPLMFSLVPCAAAVLAMSVLRPVNTRALASPVNAFTAARAGWLSLAAVCVLASCGLYGFSQSVMQVDAQDGWSTLVLCILTGVGFSALAYGLKVALGALGEVVFVLLMVLQFGACGGLYPFQTGNALFANLHPYMPMTYTVSGFRTAISGGEGSRVWVAGAVLVLLTVAGLSLATLCLAGRRQWTAERLAQDIHERCG